MLYDNINKNWAELIELLDSKNGLLDALLSVGCLKMQQKRNIETCKTDANANELLLITFATQKRCRLRPVYRMSEENEKLSGRLGVGAGHREENPIAERGTE